MAALLCGACLAVAAALGVVTYRLDGRFAAIGALHARSEVRLAEVRFAHERQLAFADAQQLAEGAVEGGTRVVQTVYRGIAAIPFAILEALPPTRPVTRVVHIAHDLIAGSVYGAISLANRGVGKAMRSVAKEPKTKK